MSLHTKTYDNLTQSPTQERTVRDSRADATLVKLPAADATSTTTTPIEPPDGDYSVLFIEHSLHGVIVGVRLPSNAPQHQIPSILTPEESSYSMCFKPVRRAAWIGGRVALRIAAQHIGLQLDTVLSTPRGAPNLPRQFVGSISHKRRIAVALIDLLAPSQPSPHQPSAVTVGVDVEELDHQWTELARLVLDREEIDHVESLPDTERSRAIATAFSVKESVFKSIDPHVQRYVWFREARVFVKDDHRADVVMRLREQGRSFDVDARWDTKCGHIVTSVRTHLRNSSV